MRRVFDEAKCRYDIVKALENVMITPAKVNERAEGIQKCITQNMYNKTTKSALSRRDTRQKALSHCGWNAVKKNERTSHLL